MDGIHAKFVQLVVQDKLLSISEVWEKFNQRVYKPISLILNGKR
jgi:hypothetical protein